MNEQKITYEAAKKAATETMYETLKNKDLSLKEKSEIILSLASALAALKA